jgi:hypothetical protein
MITRREYSIALDTVEAYHQQLNLHIVSSNSTDKTTIEAWLLQNRQNCPERIVNIITADRIRLSYRKDLEGGFSYIEDVTEKVFLLQRNAGKKTWQEFVELRGY